MAFNTSAFQEPRGVMRIIQFIFSICAFATTSGFSIVLTLVVHGQNHNIEYEYPFRLSHISQDFVCSNTTQTFFLHADHSSDAQFFVATGVLSFLYCIGIIIVYALYENAYQSNSYLPMADFILTVLLAVFWLSGSAAWTFGLAVMKSVSDPNMIESSLFCKACACQKVYIGSFSTLNVSAILGFLNFFLWAADLWFLYKETPWFKGSNPIAPTSPGVSA